MPVQLHADRARAFRQDAIGTGRLAAALPARLVRDDEPVGPQGIHDVADGLRRQLGRTREVGAGESAVDPQRVEDHAPIVRGGAVQIGAGDGADGAPGRRLGS